MQFSIVSTFLSVLVRARPQRWGADRCRLWYFSNIHGTFNEHSPPRCCAPIGLDLLISGGLSFHVEEFG